MNESAEELLKKALSLNEQDRALLAGVLIESLHGETEAGTAQAWEAEIRRRLDDLERKTVEPVPWSAVRERLFRGYE